MILIVAPHDLREPQNSSYIAGAKKTQLIIDSLLRIDGEVVLINSGHQNSDNNNLSIKIIENNDGRVIVYNPKTYRYKKLGRLFQLIKTRQIIDDVIVRYGVPKFIWLYNAYAFEMSVCLYSKKKYNIKTIIGFEDSIFSRYKGIMLKPILDWFFWIRAKKAIDVGYAVNDYLHKLLRNNGIESYYSPGIVSDEIYQISKKTNPFMNEKIVIGYFGGLTKEKGAEVILNLANKLNDDNFKFVICGNGELSEKFIELSKIQSGRFNFFGAVSEGELIKKIASTDVIVNAHNLNSGVFPFKILEALASGRLLISTKLPTDGFEDFTSVIEFYDGTIQELIQRLMRSSDIYENKRDQIKRVSDHVYSKYGVNGLSKSIRNSILK
jgi:glycosyltransferase involved in cell wall biosynthesis